MDACDAAYRRLRSLRPAKVRAIVDGQARDLAMTRGQHRWTRIIETAARMGAEALECLDVNENVVEILPLDDDDEHEPERASSDGVTEVERLVRVALDASDRAVQRHAEHTRLALDALAKVVELAVERTERLEKALAIVVRERERALEREPERESLADDLARQALSLLAGAPTPNGGNGGAHD